MKTMLRFILLAAALVGFPVIAQADDGFSVGGVGTFGGSAVNPVTENGWASLDVYRGARDCCGYTNSGNDAELWSDAINADAGSTSQISNANCAAATYPNLRSACTADGGTCQTRQRDDFLPMRDFNQQNPCLSPNYASYSDYQSAVSRGFGLNQLDLALIDEANTTGWDDYCPGSDCSTASRTQFLDAKSAKTLFQSALADAASASADGTLSWSQLVANYGNYKVDVEAPWNTAPEQDWLMAYLNSQDHNSSNPMASATHPSGWKAKVDMVTANGPAVALWVIQQIADEVSGFPTTMLTANLLTRAGVNSSITGNAAYVSNGKSLIASQSSSQLNTTAKVTAWLSSLVPPTISPAGTATVNYNVPDVATSGVQVLASLSAVTGNGSTPVFAFDNGTGTNFSINSSTGEITTTASLSNGTYTMLVVASDDNSVKSEQKTVSVVVNAAPTVSLSCGNGLETVAYSCTVTSSDADGDNLTYTLVNKPSWMTVAANGNLSGTPNEVGDISDLQMQVSDGKVTTNSSVFSITVNPNTATVLADSSATLSSSDVSNLQTLGVSPAIVNDLNNNNTCGAAGNQSCLAAFNAQKANPASACNLDGGSSASAAQMQEYIGCVMVEHHTASVASVSIPGSSTVTTGCNGGSEPINLALPVTCGHPQWTCSIQAGPNAWSISSLNELVVPANHSNGSETVTIRMSLGIYSPAYTKDVTKTYNVAGAIAGATNGMRRYSNGSDENAWDMWNSCIAKGGRMATKSEAEDLGNVGGNHVFAPNNGQNPGNRSGGNWQRWPSSSSETTCKLGNSYGRMMYGQNRWWICGSGVNQTIYYTCTDLPSC